MERNLWAEPWLLKRRIALSPADREMRILRPVVLAHPSGMVQLAQVEIMRGGTIRLQPIGHDTLGMDSDILQQLAH